MTSHRPGPYGAASPADRCCLMTALAAVLGLTCSSALCWVSSCRARSSLTWWRVIRISIARSRSCWLCSARCSRIVWSSCGCAAQYPGEGSGEQVLDCGEPHRQRVDKGVVGAVEGEHPHRLVVDLQRFGVDRPYPSISDGIRQRRPPG